MPLKWDFDLSKQKDVPLTSQKGIFLRSEDPDAPTVMLIHGLTGTPNEMGYLARFFHRKGYSVSCPRLANHGKPMHVLKATTWLECYESVRSDFLRCCDGSVDGKIYVAGLSMGSLLALLLAEEFPDRIAAVSCLSPTIFYDGWNVTWYRHLLPLIYRTPLKNFCYFKEEPPYGIKNEQLRNKVHRYFSNISLHDASSVGQYGYAYFPFTLIYQLRILVDHLTKKLPSIRVPVQIIQAKEDDMTSVKNAHYIYERISSVKKEIVLLENSYHIVTADQERAKVVRHMEEFFNKASQTDPMMYCVEML